MNVELVLGLYTVVHVGPKFVLITRSNPPRLQKIMMCNFHRIMDRKLSVAKKSCCDDSVSICLSVCLSVRKHIPETT